MSSVCYISSVAPVGDSQTVQYLSAIRVCAKRVVAICPGTLPAGLHSCIEHVEVALPQGNFWPGLRWKALLGAIASRFEGLRAIVFALIRVRPGMLVVSEPDVVVVAIVARLVFGVPFVVDVREVYFEKALAFPRPWQPWVRLALKMLYAWAALVAHEVIHVSRERQRLFGLQSRAVRIVFPYPKSNLAVSSPVRFQGNSTLKLVHAGSLRWTYAGNEILEAMRLIREAGLAVELTVVGGVVGELDVRLLDELVGSGYVRVVPFAPQNEVFAMCREAHLGLACYRPVDLGHRYAQPRKVYEYLCMALPVVTTRLPTLENVVGASGAGVCVPVEEIAGGVFSLVISVMQNPGQVEEMSRRAIEASQQFRWERVEPLLLGCFSEEEVPVL